MRLTAERLLAAYAESAKLKQQLQALITTMAPGLLDQPGVGPISAAQVLLAWSHPGRVRSEAAFAMLGGAAPIEASSARSSVTGSTGVVIASSTARCTPS
jgi:transposase